MRKPLPLSLLALALVSLAVAGAVGAAQLGGSTLKATLTAGQEVPKPTGVTPGAKGRFTATLAADGTLTWKLTFAKLSGAATAAHIHSGRAGKAGPPVVPLCGPCTSGQTGTATVSAAVAKTLKAGRSYVNVHTAKNPAGELRGQLTLRR